MANKFKICTKAMLLVGGNKVTSFSGATTEEIIAEELYTSTLDGLLADYRWRWASDYIELNRLSGLPEIKWTAQYQLPDTVHTIFGCYIDGEKAEFERVRNRILTDAAETSQVVLQVGFRPDEAEFPPYFTAVLELRLAALFAIPIAEDERKAALYEGMAMRKFAQAKAIEAQGRTPSKIATGGLRRYHGGGA